MKIFNSRISIVKKNKGDYKLKKVWKYFQNFFLIFIPFLIASIILYHESNEDKYLNKEVLVLSKFMEVDKTPKIYADVKIDKSRYDIKVSDIIYKHVKSGDNIVLKLIDFKSKNNLMGIFSIVVVICFVLSMFSLMFLINTIVELFKFYKIKIIKNDVYEYHKKVDPYDEENWETD